ncbi:hypothetical protein FAI40_06660 [Acetobacteraceae bacterium]|nr:hypothetical protein FAI40_06660 [Acetobacteraceae bacterium]
MRQGWLALITLAIASTIAGAEILHHTNEASRHDINDFLKNIPPEFGFKYSKVTPAITIQGMNIEDASFHLGTTQFFFKNLCLGHPHIEENILKFSSVTVDQAQIISDEHTFSSQKGILRHLEIIPSASKQRKWDELIFDENTLNENESFVPSAPENKEVVAAFFKRVSNQNPTLGNIRFGRLQFEKVKIDKNLNTAEKSSQNQLTPTKTNLENNSKENIQADTIKNLIQKDGFIIPSLSLENINLEGYGTGAHPVASVKNLKIKVLYNLLHQNLRNQDGAVHAIELSLDNGEIHEGGNLLQRPGREEIMAAHQFWDDPEKFFNTAPYGLTLIGLTTKITAPAEPEKEFKIPKITGERRLSAVKDKWAFKSYFNIIGIENNFSHHIPLSEEIHESLSTLGPILKITALSVPKETTTLTPESWLSKFSLDFEMTKQAQIKGSFAFSYPPLTKNIFESSLLRLNWEDNFKMSNLSLSFSGQDLSPILCNSWKVLKDVQTTSCAKIQEILHDNAFHNPYFETLVEWIANPRKKRLKTTFDFSHFWGWNNLPPEQALGQLPLKEAVIKQSF